jgi:hypothetical protein
MVSRASRSVAYGTDTVFLFIAWAAPQLDGLRIDKLEIAHSERTLTGFAGMLAALIGFF